MDTPRYQALGNAVAVPVVRWIGKRLKKQLVTTTQNSFKTEEELLSGFQDFQDKSRRHMNLDNLHLSTEAKDAKLKWQTGGLVIDNKCWDIKAPEAPTKIIHSKLIDVIQKEYPSDKYFISANAAEGILRRVYSQNRTLFEPMHQALEKLLKKQEVA